jgi:DNA-directed RNA polymerase specialized sigma24 family protein
MDLEQLVHRACEGDVNAFVALTRRFQHFAFGSALALLGDFHQAEDAVQEAFLAAWSGLPSLVNSGNCGIERSYRPISRAGPGSLQSP